MRHRASLAIPLAAATAATLAAAAAASLAPPAATGVPMAAAEPGMTVCAPLQVLARHPGSVAGLDDTTYRLNQGSVTVATPGAGFSVASADRAVRAAIGMGALPSAIRRLIEMPDMRYDPSGPLCQGRATAAPAAVSGSTSDNWGGVVVYQPGGSRAFWQAAANWTIPHFTTSCGPDSDHSMWTGIGGFAKTPARLMQAGVDTVIGDGASDPDAVYPFWEVLNYQNSPDNIEPIVRVPLVMHAGDSVTILTEYLARQDKVVFWFLDRTTGQYKLYSLTSLYGHPPSFFYDGRSAEVINENAGVAYREPTGDATQVSQVDFNSGQPASAFPADERLVTMTSNGKATGTVLDQPQNPSTYQVPGQPLRASRWSDLWEGCQGGKSAPTSKPGS